MKTKIETKPQEISDIQALQYKNYDEVLKKAALLKSRKLKWKWWGSGIAILTLTITIARILYFKDEKINSPSSTVRVEQKIKPKEETKEIPELQKIVVNNPAKKTPTIKKEENKELLVQTREEVVTVNSPLAQLNLCGVAEGGTVRKTQAVIGGRLEVYFPELEKLGRILSFEIHNNGKILRSNGQNFSADMRKYILELEDGAELELFNIQYYLPKEKIQTIPFFKVKVVDNGEMRSYGF